MTICNDLDLPTPENVIGPDYKIKILHAIKCQNHG